MVAASCIQRSAADITGSLARGGFSSLNPSPRGGGLCRRFVLLLPPFLLSSLDFTGSVSAETERVFSSASSTPLLPCVLSTKGPMWGHPDFVLGAISSFLEPFCGYLSSKIDKVSQELTLRYHHEEPWVDHLPSKNVATLFCCRENSAHGAIAVIVGRVSSSSFKVFWNL